MLDFDNPHQLNEPDDALCACGFSRRGLLLNAPCPECGEVNSTKPKGYFSNIAHKLSLTSLKVAVGIVALDIALLIFTEATNGKYGDGFMLMLPLFSWILVVLPLCAISILFTIIAAVQSEENVRGAYCVALVLIAAAILPAVTALTIVIYVK